MTPLHILYILYYFLSKNTLRSNKSTAFQINLLTYYMHLAIIKEQQTGPTVPVGARKEHSPCCQGKAIGMALSKRPQKTRGFVV